MIRGLWNKIKSILKPNIEEEQRIKYEFGQIIDKPAENAYNRWFIAPVDPIKVLRLSYRKERSQRNNWSRWRKRK